MTGGGGAARGLTRQGSRLLVANRIGGVQDSAYLEVQQRLRPPEIQQLPVELRELGPSYRGINPEGNRRWMEIEGASRPEGPGGPGQPLRDPMTYERLEMMRVPVLVLAGDADLLPQPVAEMQLWNGLTPCPLSNSISPTALRAGSDGEGV